MLDNRQKIENEFSPAQAHFIDRAEILLGEDLHNRLLVFPSLHPKAQIRAVAELEELGMPVERTSRAASIKRRKSNPDFESKRDPALRELQKGHLVEILAEVSPTGISREQAGFLKKISAFGRLLILKQNNPQIAHLKLAPGSYPVSDRLELGGVKELLQLWESNPHHPAFGTAADTKNLIIKIGTAEYCLKSFRGKIIEPPCGSNNGIIKLDTGEEIESISAKFVNIIGVDKDLLSNWNPRELFRGQKVWVYFNRQWEKATVTSPDEYRGMATLVCERVVQRQHDSRRG